MFYQFGSYGTAKSSLGIFSTAVLRPDLMIKSVIPVVMAGIIAVSPSHVPHGLYSFDLIA